MKKYWFPLIFLLTWMSACSTTPISDRQDRQQFQFTVTDYAEIGYGSVFSLETQEKPSRTLALTVLVGEDSLFPDLQLAAMNQRFEGTFAFESDHAPYRHMPITGFVDDNMKVWKLVSLKKLQPLP